MSAFANLRRPATIAVAIAASLGIAACGGRERPEADLAAAQVTTIGVNSYLWRAALDAVSFAPLLQVDSNGGVIVTDWYANPSNPGERVKMTVTILDSDLRADALARGGQPPGQSERHVGGCAGTGGNRAKARRHHPHQGARAAPRSGELICGGALLEKRLPIASKIRKRGCL